MIFMAVFPRKRIQACNAPRQLSGKRWSGLRWRATVIQLQQVDAAAFVSIFAVAFAAFAGPSKVGPSRSAGAS